MLQRTEGILHKAGSSAHEAIAVRALAPIRTVQWPVETALPRRVAQSCRNSSCAKKSW